MKKILGILGGMGPLTSAEFLQTIYECNLTDIEQESPTCILYSDPTFPDRTEAILKGTEDLAIARLIEALENLGKLGVTKIAIACVTMHYFLPKIPLAMQKKVVSLIDIIFEDILKTKKPHLLLCTKGTRKAGIFQKSERWSLAEPYVVFPSEEDQNIIHQFIYKIKGKNHNESIVAYIDYLDELVQKYQVNYLIAGCTEFHLVNKQLMKLQPASKNYRIVDPLFSIATNFWRFINA